MSSFAQPGDTRSGRDGAILAIKLAHSVIFWILSACVLAIVEGAVRGRATAWTWWAVGLVAAESVVLAAFRGRCPLTVLAERLGAEHGAVTDIFLPKWAADRIFPVCGTTFVAALAVLLFRVLS